MPPQGNAAAGQAGQQQEGGGVSRDLREQSVPGASLTINSLLRRPA